MTVRDMVRWLVLSVWAGAGGVNDDTQLFDGGMDAAGLRTLIKLLRDQFVVDVDDDEVSPESFGSIAQIASFVESKLAAPQTSRFGSAAVWQQAAPMLAGNDRELDDWEPEVAEPAA